MDVYTPPKEKANPGKGIIWCVSGGWFSAKPSGVGLAKEFVDRGYVVFAVVHGSQPKFSIPEVLDDMHRAVRFIKFNAEEVQRRSRQARHRRQFDAGGHAIAHAKRQRFQGWRPQGERTPVNRESSKIAAIACFFPPTDFLNYGKEGEYALDNLLKGFKAPFDFHELKDGKFVEITDIARRREIAKEISPAYHVKKGSAPATIIPRRRGQVGSDPASGIDWRAEV